MDDAMRDMEAAAHEVSECRRKASEARQAGFHNYAAFLLANAKGAEKWLVKAGAGYPNRCDAQGRKVR